jgi:tetratricopeptide (TPR) repeat protein
MAETISMIEGADYYMDQVRLVNARLDLLEGRSGVAETVDEIMSRPSVTFAKQHIPRYQLIAGDIHAGLGDHDRALAYYLEALQGGTFGSQQWLRSEVERRLGHLFKDNNFTVSESYYRAALATAIKQRAVLFELRAGLALATLLNNHGRGDEAAELLAPICARVAEDGPDLTAARNFLEQASVPMS